MLACYHFFISCYHIFAGQRGLAIGKACRWYINVEIPEIIVLPWMILTDFFIFSFIAVDQVEPNTNSPLDINIALRHQVGDYLRKSLAEFINFNLLHVTVWRK
jgi:hypothetical protein